MRVAVIALLLANLLFFAWARWIDVPASRAVAGTLAALPLAAAQGAPLHCWTTGPMRDVSTETELAAALTKQGVGSRPRTADREVQDGFLVYVGNLQGAQARQRAMARLARAGVRDAAEMPAGQPADRISAGIFTERDGAQQRLARVRATGLEAAIEDRFRTISEIWLDIDLKADLMPPTIPAGLTWADCPSASGG